MPQSSFLVAVDVAHEAADVMQAAQKLAKQCDARLTCLSVVQPLSSLYGGLYIAPYAVSSISFEEEAVRQVEAKLLTLAAGYGVDEKDVLVKLGNPSSEIQAAAKELNSDLIIMGSHARKGLGRLLGSTANAVLHGMPCDAHIVKVPAA